MKRLLLSCVLLALATPALAAADAALLPADGFQGGWKKSAPPRVFTKADLYGHIDGGAEVFLELGFEELTVQHYRNGADEIVAEIYRMSDPSAAYGIYVSKCGREIRDPRVTARHTLSKFQLMFLRNRYFVLINNNGGKDAVTPSVVAFGNYVLSRLPADATVPALALLPGPGQVKDSARLVRGQYTLQAIYTLGDGDVLQMGGTITGAAAEYKGATGAYTLIAVEYPNPPAAARAFGYLAGHLDSYLKPQQKAADRLVFKDYENKFGVVTVTGKRLEVRVHLATEK
jgi:hypothetical protein